MCLILVRVIARLSHWSDDGWNERIPGRDARIEVRFEKQERIRYHDKPFAISHNGRLSHGRLFLALLLLIAGLLLGMSAMVGTG